MTSASIAVAVFVKTPGMSPIKTRLAAEFGESRAIEFYRRSLSCIADVLQAATLHGEVHPFWAVAEPAGMTDPLWSGFDTISQGTGTLGERLDRVYGELTRRFAGVILLGADYPQLTLRQVLNACDALSTSPTEFRIGRVGDGGFSLFAGAAAIPGSAWRSVNYSCATTADELVEFLRPIGAVREFAMGEDVDTLDDLRRIVPELEAGEALLSQRGLAAWVREELGKLRD